MRKADFLRKAFNKLNRKEEIYYISLPECFKNHGDFESPHCIPLGDADGLCGISVIHNYTEDGNVFTYNEDFVFRKINHIKI